MLRSIGEFDVRLPLSRVESSDISLRQLTIKQTARQHDQAVIRLRSRTMRWAQSLSSGTPIRIFWRGRSTDDSQFVGYITHVRPYVKSADNVFEFDIVAVAASRDLRVTGKNTWKNKSAPDIVKDIGKQFGFKVVTKPHPLKRPQTVQHGETYWEFLNRLAQRIGYTLRVEQTTIFFLPLEDMIQAAVSQAPRLTTLAEEDEGDWDEATIASFSAWGGSTTESTEYSADTAIVVAVDPITGQAVEESADPGTAVKRGRRTKPPYKKYEPVIAHNRKDAKALAQGKASNGMMAVDAQMECVGYGSLAPYRPVYLTLTEPDLNGWWIVKSVTHTIEVESGNYICDVTVSTDSLTPSAIPPRKKNRSRDVGREKLQGWKLSPAISKLKVTKPGFVVGKTADGQNACRWVAV